MYCETNSLQLSLGEKFNRDLKDNRYASAVFESRALEFIFTLEFLLAEVRECKVYLQIIMDKVSTPKR